MRVAHEKLVERARDWVKANDCPLPLDLAAELMGAGLDVQTIEDELLHKQERHQNGN